jgi:hypothetical protein
LNTRQIKEEEEEEEEEEILSGGIVLREVYIACYVRICFAVSHF